MSDRMPVKTAKTVFEIIESLIKLEGARLSELSDHLDMPNSTLHDHLLTLSSMGVIVKSGDEYHASTRFLEIGEQVRNQMKIYQVSRSEIDQLADKTGEHTSLMIEENGRGVLIYITKGENAVNLDAYAGLRLPLSAAAPGKVILAHLPEERVHEIVDQHGLPQFTENTITERKVLLDELDTIRERGHATDTGELTEGVRAMSVPVISRDTVQGSISIGGPQSRMSGEWYEEELPDLLRRTANVIELNLTHA